MDALKQNLEIIDFADVDGHKRIYTQIEREILTNIPSSTCPAIDVITYAINNILYPTLLPKQIPDLLNLLAQAELIRRRVKDQAEAAVEWNRFYLKQAKSKGKEKEVQDAAKAREDGRDVRLLTEEDLEVSARLTDEQMDRVCRKTYVGVVFNLIIVHVNTLWIDSESHRLSVNALRDYFPARYESESSCRFHGTLNEEETAELYNTTAATCVRFRKDAALWEAGFEKQWIKKGYGPDVESLYKEPKYVKAHAQEFQKRYPLELAALEKALPWYLRTVESMVDSLEFVFE